jgi:hypothetical protein
VDTAAQPQHQPAEDGRHSLTDSSLAASATVARCQSRSNDAGPANRRKWNHADEFAQVKLSDCQPPLLNQRLSLPSLTLPLSLPLIAVSAL